MSWTAKQTLVMREVYQQLDSLPMSFGLPAYSDDLTDAQIQNYIGINFKKAMREFGYTDDNFDDEYDDDSTMATYFVDRALYHLLRKFRFTSSVYFKFSSAQDGRQLDRTKVFDNLNKIIEELDEEYKSYVKGTYHHGIWTRTYDSYEWAEE